MIDGHTRLAAVVANPIKHSLSPFIHNLAFDLTQENGVYLAFETQAEELSKMFDTIRLLNMYGINLSMPYKQEAIRYVDELTPVANMIGAINTVINQDGRLIGHTTDGAGFFNGLDAFEIKDSTMTIIGAGGAARAIIAEAVLRGAEGIKVYNRTVTDELKNQLESYGLQVCVHPLDQLESVTTDLLVNATSVGMDGVSMPFSKDVRLSSRTRVVDIIYQPLETPLLAWAREQGLAVQNGLPMLLFQAAEAFELWTGKSMPTAEIMPQLAQKFSKRKLLR
jgi:shikimate dehydrogenase